MVSKARARNPKDKTARRQQLLDAAAALHHERGLDWTVLEVAARAGLAKGTTYLYFRTKEELLLELLEGHLSDWFLELEALLEAPRDDPARAIAQSIAARPALVALLAIQASILEQNLSPEAAARFKRFLLMQTQRLAPRLERWLPGSDGLELLQWLNALVIGLAQLAWPSAVVAALLESEELRPLRIDFQSALERSLRALLAGIRREERP